MPALEKKNTQTKDGFPLVSIVTCVYNGEDHLEQTIQSVLAQSYQNIEYIIIDGGSTDKTLEIIKKYENNIDVIISEKDKGIADAMNKGISLAKGSIIGLIHADDWYEIDAISLAVTQLRKFDIVYGDLLYWKFERPHIVYKGKHELIENEMTLSHPTMFIKKSVYERYGLYDLEYKCAMDYDKILLFYLKGCSFVKINSTLANFRLNGVSDEKWIRTYNEVRLIKNKLIGNPIKNFIYFVFQLIKTLTSRILQSMNLNKIINIYRKSFSKIAKEIPK